MDDLIREFVEETSEALSEVESDLLEMEQHPDAEHDVGNLFRLVHTIKGTCSFIGLDRLGGLAHAAENILGKVRDREMGLSADAVSTILEAVDVITQLLEGTADTGAEPEIDVAPLVTRLNAFADASGSAATSDHQNDDMMEMDIRDFPGPDDQDVDAEADSGLDDLDLEFGSNDTADDEADDGKVLSLADILGIDASAGHGDEGANAVDADLQEGFDDDTFGSDTEHADSDPDEPGALTLSAILGDLPDTVSVDDEDFSDADDDGEAENQSSTPSVNSIGDILANATSSRGAESSDASARSAPTNNDQPLTMASILAQCGPGKGQAPRPENPPPEKKSAPQPRQSPAAAAKASLPAAKEMTPPARDLQAKTAPPAKAEEAKDAPAKGAQSGATLRVNVELLEHMMTLVGELVLTRNQLSQLARQQSNGLFETSLQRLDQVTGELQEGIMKTRMQPIGNAWNKLPRILRDLSKDLGKKIELEMIGADTELDRQVLELIKDPLTHMVRNSADHGIESSDARKAAGKPEVGTVRLAAAYKESHVVITLSDDGGGLDAVAIRRRIVERGLAKADEAEAMTDHQMHQFIFAPGFSTATTVTSVSGRGVGMDVVRTNIEKIGGSVSLESELGAGTCFTIRIPLTLAILPVLIIGSGDERYGLPQINLQEVVQIRDRDNSGIERVSGSLLYHYRDDLIPIIELDEICGRATSDLASAYHKKFIVICRFGTITFGLICDSIFDTEEIIAKPVAKILNGIRYFSGTAILGDGAAIFVLDPNALAAKVGSKQNSSQAPSEKADEPQPDIDRTFQMIVFECVDGTRKALPITLVDRVEEFGPEQLEQIDQKIVVQYEGKLMPILEIDQALLHEQQKHSVIVFHDNDNFLGMKIAEICDIAELEIETDIEDLRPGCLGATVSEGRVIEILDVSYMMSTCFPQKYGARSVPYAGGTTSSVEILLVDDSKFFRNFVGPLLRTSGYNTTVVEHPRDALEMFDKHPDFDVIISDIEMPEMDGYELLRCIRQRPGGKDVPVIALSSYGSKTDIERGLNAGFNAYVSKLDKDGLLKALQRAIIETEMVA
ncbi:MAG: hybrid sensor histidine kinase/response regulator [Minwuia sp.]|nr:hybrid sensor histidine kinase/response regulator [Minwuia sp.]